MDRFLAFVFSEVTDVIHLPAVSMHEGVFFPQDLFSVLMT